MTRVTPRNTFGVAEVGCRKCGASVTARTRVTAIHDWNRWTQHTRSCLVALTDSVARDADVLRRQARYQARLGDPCDAWADVRKAADELLDAVRRVKRSAVYKNLIKEDSEKEANTLPGGSDKRKRRA